MDTMAARAAPAPGQRIEQRIEQRIVLNAIISFNLFALSAGSDIGLLQSLDRCASRCQNCAETVEAAKQLLEEGVS